MKRETRPLEGDLACVQGLHQANRSGQRSVLIPVDHAAEHDVCGMLATIGVVHHAVAVRTGSGDALEAVEQGRQTGTNIGGEARGRDAVISLQH